MVRESKELKSKAFQMEFREYRYSKTVIFSWLAIALSFFILAFISFLEKELAFRIPGILLFLTGLFWLTMLIHALSTITLATTEDEIIFSDRPFSRHLHIMVKDIVKIKIQMDSLIQSGVLIWFEYQDKIRKVRIAVKNYRKGDQTEFLDYVRNITK